MSEPAHPHRRLPKFVRIVRARPRLFTCALIGLAVLAGLMLTNWGIASRLLVAWDIAVGLYLILALHMMARADVHHIRRRVKLQDEGQVAILVLTAIAALASLGAIVALLSTSRRTAGHATDLLLATLTIVLSWAFTHTMFALHYAHEYYDQNAGKGGGLTFPNANPEPDYWDFMYFAFTIGMTSQVSDVTIACKPIRRTVFAHSVIS